MRPLHIITKEANVAVSELRSRLDHLNQRIERAHNRLNVKGLLSADHKITASDLSARYAALSAKVHEDTADAEAHGHHVSDLEKSVREWLDSLEIDVD